MRLNPNRVAERWLMFAFFLIVYLVVANVLLDMGRVSTVSELIFLGALFLVFGYFVCQPFLFGSGEDPVPEKTSPTVETADETVREVMTLIQEKRDLGTSLMGVVESLRGLYPTVIVYLALQKMGYEVSLAHRVSPERRGTINVLCITLSRPGGYLGGRAEMPTIQIDEWDDSLDKATYLLKS